MLTLQDCLDLWLSEAKLSLAETTYENYCAFARWFVESIGRDHPISQLTYQNVMVWVNAKSKTCNKNTMRTLITRCKTFFGWCLKHGYINTNPAQRIVLPRVRAKADDERAISHEDRDKLLRYAYYTSKRNFAIIMFLSSTFCRITACSNLRIPDLNLDDLSAKVIEKGGRYEVVTYDNMTALAIQRWIEVRPHPKPKDHGYLWISERSLVHKKLGSKAVRAMLHRVSEAAGCSKIINAHQLRHRGGQDWSLDPNVSMVDTQNKLNHSSLKSTYIYYADGSKRVGSISQNYLVLPEDVAEELKAEQSASDVDPPNVIRLKFTSA